MEIMQGLCLLVCDASSSMDKIAIPDTDITKLRMMTRIVDRVVSELASIVWPENAFIGIIAFGARAAFIPDKQGKPLLRSVSEMNAQFRDNLGEYILECIQADKAGIDRRYVDITAALALARCVYDCAVSGDLGRFGIDRKCELDIHDICTHDAKIVSVPNVRVMLYSSGEHNPSQPGMLLNLFSTSDISPLITVCIGDDLLGESSRRGADQMLELANICPAPWVLSIR